MLDDAYTSACKAVPDAFSVNCHVSPDEYVLVLGGQADVAAGPVLADALSQASAYRHARVSVDLAGLEFIDAYCLAIIFGARDELRDRGTDLVLRSPRPPVRRLLDILARQDLIENA